MHDGAPLRRSVLSVGLILAACLMGVAVVGAGGSSSIHTMVLGAAAVIAIGAVTSVIADLPVLGLARIAFIASFFFKGDLNLIKIDEIEDPSGLNLSITLLAGLFLLFHDVFVDAMKDRVFPVHFSLAVIGLMLCALFSVLSSGATTLGGVSLVSLATSIMIAYVTASHFGRPERIKLLVVGIGIGVLVTGVVALLQYAVQWPLNLPIIGTGTEEEQLGTQSIVFSRVPGFLRTPNGMAWVISSLIPIVAAPLICRVKSFTSQQRMILIGAVAAGIVGVILSLARGSWIGLVTALALLIMFGWIRLSKPERKSYVFVAGGAVVLVLALLLPFSSSIYNRLTADDEGAASIRTPLLENAVLMIQDNPLTGVGMNGYRTHMAKYDETGIFVSQVFQNPVHNVFAHVTAEIGLPGGLLFCFLILAALYECLRTMASGDRLLFALALGAAIGLVAFVISGMKEPAALGSVRPPMRTLFLMLGTVMAVGRIRRMALFDQLRFPGRHHPQRTA